MNKRVYAIGNSGILLITVLLFVFSYESFFKEGINNGPFYFAFLGLIVICINLIKSFRFYFIIAGQSSITKIEFFKQYLKTTPVSVILPFKLGDLFRIYCFGYQMGDVFKSLIFVLLARFFDTVALITVVVATSILSEQSFSGIIWLLILFVAVIMILYFAVPSICRYWRTYLLEANANKRNLKLLEIICNVAELMEVISKVLKGKGTIVFSLSAFSWVIELSGMYLLENAFGSGKNAGFVGNYLAAALGLTQLPAMDSFVVCTVVILLAVYVVLHFVASKGKVI